MTIARRGAGDRLRILGYHNVTPSWTYPGDAAAYERGLVAQFRALARYANVVPLGPALERIAGGGRLPPRAVAISVDDGYRDNLEVAVPLLRQLGLPATFFLVPGLLAGTTRAWWEHLAAAFATGAVSELEWDGTAHRLGDPLARRRAFGEIAEDLKRHDRATREAAVQRLVAALRPPAEVAGDGLFVDWEGARAIVAAGFEVGSHTVHHPILPTESEDEQRRELEGARTQLEEGLGRTVTMIAYPNGRYDATTLRLARAAGYRFGITATPGIADRDSPPLECPRTLMTGISGLAGLARLTPVARLPRGIRRRLRGMVR